MLYEIVSEDRQFANFENVMLEHEKEYSKDEFQELIREARYDIEDFIEESYDEFNDKMVRISDTCEEYSYLIGVVDWLCEYKGFKRWFPVDKITVYLDG